MAGRNAGGTPARLWPGGACCSPRRGFGALAALGAAVLAVVAPVAVPAAGAAGPDPASTSGSLLQVEPVGNSLLWVDGRPYAGDVAVAPDGSGLAVVNRVGFEQYVEGIGEMPSNWPAAALQAQAVAARTYALWSVLTHRPGPAGGQICASDYCQVYSGLTKARSAYGSAWVAAVQATSGQVLTYQSRVIEALYGSSDGGQTLDGGVPWLPAISDPQDSIAPEHQWSWREPVAALAPILGVPAGQTLVSVVSSPRAITETLRAADGSTSTSTLAPDSFHSLINSHMPAPAGLDLPLPSWRYSVSTYGTDVVVEGWGDGQGMGMSQYGALGKAMDGWTAGQILGDYYRGTALGALPAGEMPQTISVTLDRAAPGALIQASGPVQIVDQDGHVLAATPGAASWHASPGGPGVSLAATAGAPPGAVPAERDLSRPIPMTAPAPARAPSAPAGTVATTAPPATGPAPTTSTTSTGAAAPIPAPPIRLAGEVTGGSGRRPGSLPPAPAVAAIILVSAVAAATARTRMRRAGRRAGNR